MIVCKNCGTKNEDRNVCRKCGAFLYKKNTIRETDPAVLKQMRKNKIIGTLKGMGLSFLVIIGAFIVLSVIMFLLFTFISSKLDWPTEEELLEELEEYQESTTSSVTVIPPQ